jgi:radical SAM superfamily enzyme YgiQ (UPF0313 family)
LTFAQSFDVLKNDVLDADLVGFSSTSPLFGITQDVFAYVKKINPKIKTVIGGPHPTLDPAGVIDAGFDFAVMGEGEATILELAQALRGGCWDKVKGIAYRQEDSQVKINDPAPFIQDLDAVPLIDRSLLNYSRYFTFGIMATRGCPFLCSFCKPMQDKLFGNRIRRRSIKNIVDEIEILHRMDRRKVIYFKDDTLTICQPDWFRDFGLELKQRNLKLKWGCNARVDTVDREKLEAMKEAGCVGLAFGVESGSQKILDFYRKGIKVAQTIEAFALCRKLKLQTLAFVMLGAPIETRQDMDQTYALMRRIKPDLWYLFIATPFPGNYLHEYAKQRGIIKIANFIECDNAQNSQDLKLTMDLDHLTKEDIREYRDKINHYMIRATILRRGRKIFTDPEEFKKLVLETPKAVNLVKRILLRY